MYEEEMVEMDDQTFWQQAEDTEARARENDWQDLLDNDQGYHDWTDHLDRETEEDREIMVLAGLEDERNFRTLQPWD